MPSTGTRNLGEYVTNNDYTIWLFYMKAKFLVGNRKIKGVVKLKECFEISFPCVFPAQ